MRMLSRMAVAGSAALFVTGSVLAQGLPPLGGPPAAEPTPAPAAAPGGMITYTNADSLKALFDAAGVPVELKTNDKGYTYLIGQPEGFIMFVYPTNCEGNSKTGKCPIVALESGLWNKPISVDQANDFNEQIRFSNATVYPDTEGKPVIEYTVALNAGVSPDYLKATFRYFTNDMSGFLEYLNSLGAAAPAGASKPGFASETGSTNLIDGGVGKPTTERAGAAASYGVAK